MQILASIGSPALRLWGRVERLFSRPTDQLSKAERRLIHEAIIDPGDGIDAKRRMVRQALDEDLGVKNEEFDSRGPWIEEFFDSAVIYQWDGKLFHRPFAVQTIEGQERVTFSDAAEVKKVFQTVESSAPTESAQESDFAVMGELVALTEANGTPAKATIKIIQPGQGSSAFYPSEVLKRDGPKVATKGTHMYWDHPTATEASERPERSLRDLAAVLSTDAAYQDQGPKGPGLYAEADIQPGFAAPLASLAGNIGVSIRGHGKVAERATDSGNRAEVQQLTSLESVDFVTKPGAGGEILSLFEAARSRQPNQPQQEGTTVTDEQATALETKITAVEGRNKVLEGQLLTLQAKEESRAYLAAALEAGQCKDLPEPARIFALDETCRQPPVKDDGSLDVDKLRESLSANIKRVAELGASFSEGGQVTGAGGSAPTESDLEERRKKANERVAELQTNRASMTGRDIPVSSN